MVWGLFSIIGVNLADSYFVGQLGSRELSAIGFTAPVVMVLGTLILGIGSGTASALALALGKRNHSKIKRLATDSLLLALIIVSFLVGVGLLTIHPFFQFLGAPNDVLPLIEDYMSVWYVAMIFLVVPMVSNSILRASGETRVPGLIMGFTAFLNLILDPVLIFGLGGLPALGVKGAAIATLLARIAATIPALYILHVREQILDLSIPLPGEVFASFREILYVGIPAAGSSMIQPITGIIITKILSGFGKESVAAFGLVQRMESFSLIIVIALASGLGPFVGQNWGAREPGRVREAIIASMKFCLGWGLFSAALLGIFSGPLTRIFSEDIEIRLVAVLYLVMVPWSYCFESLRLIATATLNAMRKPLPATALMALRMFGLYVPLALFLSSRYGVAGVFWATVIANVSVGTLSLLYLWYVLRNPHPSGRF